MSVAVRIAVLYLREIMKLDYLWAGLCLLGAVYFMFSVVGSVSADR
jgi:uncharacterized protein